MRYGVTVLSAAVAALGLAACGQGVNSAGDAQWQAAREELAEPYRRFPATMRGIDTTVINIERVCPVRASAAFFTAIAALNAMPERSGLPSIEMPGADATAFVTAWTAFQIERRIPEDRLRSVTIDALAQTIDARSGYIPVQAVAASKLNESEPYAAGVQSVTLRMHGAIGVIAISAMDEETPKLVSAAVVEARRAKPKVNGYVLDLRKNHGGLFSIAGSLADAFLDRDTLIGSTVGLKDCGPAARSASEAETLRTARGDETDKAPIAILIGPETAGAAELFVAAMSETGRARTVGQRTHGQGILQTTFPLGPGLGSVRLASSEIRTSKEGRIEGVGIAPSVETPIGEDALTQALGMLQ